MTVIEKMQYLADNVSEVLVSHAVLRKWAASAVAKMKRQAKTIRRLREELKACERHIKDLEQYDPPSG